MNEQIINLAVKAGILNYVDNETPRRYFIDAHADIEEVNEFAKLIIKECFSLVESCALIEAAVPETYLGESLNVAMRITDAGNKIKEHFGVEE